MKKWILYLLILCSALVLGACANKDSRIAQIRARNNGAGELRVGVKVDVPNFGYLNPESGELEGLEIDIAREMAQQLVGKRDAVRFVPTTGMAKETLLANGEADLIIGTYTITDERKKVVNFSRPYYVDEIGFLVMDGAEIHEIADFAGKTIGVTRASTAFSTFDQHPEILGDGFILQGFTSYPEIQDALINGAIDIFSADKSILSGYQSEYTAILEAGVQPQPYGIGSVFSDKAFAEEVDKLLGKMIEDGTLDAILEKWLK
jgi:ABC-type amino acid transport/signal transduction systems, periplasmic component/domain